MTENETVTSVVILPEEVKQLAGKVAVNKREEVNTVLSQIFAGTADWERQVELIEVNTINDKMGIQLAETARKNVKTARLNAEKIFDAKREAVQAKKAEYDTEDKLWLKAKQIMQITFRAIEEKAEWKAGIVARHQAEQKELRTQKRIAEVALYQDQEINRIEFENMTDENFEFFLSGLKAQRDKKIWEQQKADEERLAQQKADEEAREAQRKENERLRQEAEANRKKLEAERKENERKIAEQQKAADAKLKEEQEARRKLEQELQNKLIENKKRLEAEEKAKAEQLAAQEKERKAAEKLAQQPVKKQLTVWVKSFELPETECIHETKDLITKKFEAFKNWAQGEINKI